MTLFLDTGVIGLLTHPKGSDEATECTRWLRDCIVAGSDVCVPEIADYELRRELLRNNSREALSKLDQLIEDITKYLPLSTEAMRQAAIYWARMRNQGTPTAPDDALDADMILAAQAHTHLGAIGAAIIVTTNVGHLERVAHAKNWRDLPPDEY